MTPEMAHATNIAEGSLAVPSFKDSDVTAEILAPQGEGLTKEVRQVVAEFGEALAEMRRRGH